MSFRETKKQKVAVKNIVEALNGQPKRDQKEIKLYQHEYDIEKGKYKYIPSFFYGNDKVSITKKLLLKNQENTQEELLWQNIDYVRKSFTLRFNCGDEDSNTYVYLKSILEFYKRFGWTKYIVFVHDENDIGHIYDVLNKTGLGKKFPKMLVQSRYETYNLESQTFEKEFIEKDCYFDLLNIFSPWLSIVLDEDRDLFISKIEAFLMSRTPVILIINYARVLNENSKFRLHQLSDYSKEKTEPLTYLELLFTTKPIVIIDDYRFEYRYLSLTSQLKPLFTIATERWLHDFSWLCRS